jgi:fermentation-respiration switch protein FrsA (DUF1100 family)
MTRALVVLLGAPALVLALVYGFQRFLIYLPSGSVPGVSAVLPDGEEVRFTTSDGLRLSGWFLPAASAHPGPAVLVANGNAGNRAHRAPLAEALREAGASVLLFDYRGFGGNPGTPSEKGLRRDALAALDYLTGRPEVDPDRIVYFGESIGAAVVVGLATERPPAGLILRSPFVSLTEVGRLHYPWLPVRLLLKDRYEVAEDVARVKSPVLVVAGEKDGIVPVEQSRAVYDAAAGTKRFLLVEDAGHNDPALFVGDELMREVHRFLGEVARAAPEE